TFDAPIAYGVIHSPNKMLGADVNDDGDLDLLVIGGTIVPGTTLTVLNGRGDGTFGPNFSTGPAAAGCVVFGDLDGDGRKDMLVGNTTTGDIAVFHALGLGGFELAGDLFVGNAPASIALADLDENGTLDVAAVNLDGGLKLFFGNGDGTFGPGLFFAT